MNNNIQKELTILNKKINNIKKVNKPKTFPKKVSKPKTFPKKVSKPKTFPKKVSKPKTFPKKVNKSKPLKKKVLSVPIIDEQPTVKITFFWKIIYLLLFLTIIILTCIILYRIYHTLYIYEKVPLPGTSDMKMVGAPVNKSGDMTENPYLTLYGKDISNLPGLDSDMHRYRDLNYKGNFDDGITKKIYKFQRKQHTNDFIRKYNKSVININKSVDKYNDRIEDVRIPNRISEDEKRDLVDLYEIKEYEQETKNSLMNYPEWTNNITTNSVPSNCSSIKKLITCNNGPFCYWEDNSCKTTKCSDLSERNCNEKNTCGWFINKGKGTCINV